MSEFDLSEPGVGPAPAPVADGNPYLADELAGASGDGAGTVLEMLEAELAADDTSLPTVRLALKRNPDYVVVFRTNLDGGEIERARAQSRDRKKVDGVDGPKFAALICVTACVEIWRRGVRLTDEQERPLRFNHRAFLQAFNARSAVTCAQAFYRDDAYMDACARRVMADSGWGEDAQDVTAVDPPADAST